MLRFYPIANAKAAVAYYSKADAGTYYAAGELRQEWLGKGAELLGLSGTPDFEHFRRLIHGLDPHTGEQLTAKLVENRVPAWDVTASIPKGVTIALERGDTRIQDALWEAARETIADLEQYATTRVRKGGALDDRVTGNLVAFAVEHPETRPAKADNMPDPDRHLHMVVMNVTRDPVEGEWKAVKFRPVMDLRKFFDRRFDLRLSSKLTDLGYGIETKRKDGKYYSWDIKGVPESAVRKFSRRAGEVEALAAELGVGSAVGKDKLGATSRAFKRTDLTLEDYRQHWLGRLTSAEDSQIEAVIAAANLGENPRPANTADKAVSYALAHEFERRSVMKWTDLAVTAMERCMGGAVPEEIEPEARRQGALLKDGQATTRAVLAEESRIIDFAREGKGTMRPLARDAGASPDTPSTQWRRSEEGQSIRESAESARRAEGTGRVIAHTATLSPEQQALVSHILTSTDRVVLVVGDTGTGKTSAVRSAFDRVRCPVAMMAPSAEASRGVLRKEGFSTADTVASFLLSTQRQQSVKDGVIWVDEAGLLPIRDLSRLTDIAKEQNARIVLQGDPKQHRSVARHGNMMNVLEEYAGLKVGRLTEIWRQKHKGYKQVVADIATGKREQAFDGLADLGWVQTVEDHSAVVTDYLAGERAGKDQLLIAPSHAEGDAITAGIRSRLHVDGKLGEDHAVKRFVNLNWSAAERGDAERFAGDETLVFHQNSGAFKKGEAVKVADLAGDKRRWKSPEHFGVFREETLPVAAGDLVRITQGGTSKDGHRLNNGAVYRVKGFGKDGGIILSNDWALKPDFGHLAHGYVGTSHASQGKTVDRVLVAMGGRSRGALSAEQFYVSLSRAKFEARVYTDLPPADLKQAIGRTDTRKSATELMKPKPRRPKVSRVKWWMEKARDRFRKLREPAITVTKEREHERQRERSHAYER